MVLLSDRELRKALESGRLGVDPFDPAMVHAAGIEYHPIGRTVPALGDAAP